MDLNRIAKPKRKHGKKSVFKIKAHRNAEAA